MKAYPDKSFPERRDIMTDTEYGRYLKISPRTAHKRLFDEYCDYVYAVVSARLRLCGSKEDADECVSDIFYDLYKALEKCSDTGRDLKGLVITISKRRAVDAYRRLSSASGTGSFEDISGEDIPGEEDIPSGIEKKERDRIIISLIKELGEPDSLILIWQYYYRLPAKEIAKRLSMSENSVNQRSSRARKKLKQRFIDAGIEGGR